MATAVCDVHLVGSLRLPGEPENPLTRPPSARDVFETMSEELSTGLRRLPDGETGTRFYFVDWQNQVFERSPWIMNDRLPRTQVFNAEAASKLEIKLGPVGYDQYAIESYMAFADLQSQGKIHPSTRFQVCIPTAANALAMWVHPSYQAKVEPLYERALCDAIRNIQAEVPPEKLSIQIDCAVDMALLEGCMGPRDFFKPWFNPTADAIVHRIATIAGAVDKTVDLGFHLCYGDIEHQHFMQPKDSFNLVRMANLIAEKVSRPINFLHMPVPKDRDDDAYFLPLQQLHLSDETEVYLGLVHANDLAGTQRKVQTARKYIRHFGISTECGLGRTSVKDVESILKIFKTIDKPM